MGSIFKSFWWDKISSTIFDFKPTISRGRSKNSSSGNCKKKVFGKLLEVFNQLYLKYYVSLAYEANEAFQKFFRFYDN